MSSTVYRLKTKYLILDRRIILTVVVLFAVILRLWLAVINAEANDDHLGVVDIIRSELRLPQRDECWECFQPKLYHLTVATGLELLPNLPRSIEIRIAQLINVLASVGTLYLIYRFLSEKRLSQNVLLMTFALVAVNPRFIGLSVQATNDAFIIFFSTLAIYFSARYMEETTSRNAVFMISGAVLAAMSKGSGLLVLIGVLALLIFRLTGYGQSPPTSRKAVLAHLTMFLAFLPVVMIGGQYWEKICAYGSPFVTNESFDPLPHLTDHSSYGRPGIISIKNSYLTFMFFDLLRNPITSGEVTNFPWHRTSLWSQLYGQAHFLRFDDWPQSWRTSSLVIQEVGRAALLVGLLPTAILGLGVVISPFGTFRNRFRIRTTIAEAILMAFYLVGFIALIVVYTLQHRAYPSMKVIFVYPALLPMAYFFSIGLTSIKRIPKIGPIALQIILILVTGLVIIYIIDVVGLIFEMPYYLIPPTTNSFTIEPLPKISSALPLCKP